MAFRKSIASIIALVCTTAALGQEATGVTPPLRKFAVAGHFGLAKQRPFWNVDPLLPRLKELGVWAVRDGASWGSVEKEKGRYDLGETTRHWVDAVTKSGIKVVFVFGGNGNTLYDNPLDPDAYAAAAAFVAGAFKDNPNVIAIELWNEPNNFGFRKQYGGEWNGNRNAAWVEKFAELVQKSSAAVRSANPSIKIITGAGATPATHHLLQRFPDAFKNVDGLTEHPYPYRLPPESVPFGGADIEQRDGVASADDQHSMRSMFTMAGDASDKALGRRLPIWVTEFGYTTFRKQTKNSLYAGYTETAQAAYHARALIQGLASGVALWTAYDLVDDGTDAGDAEQNFGLLRNKTHAPKPAFTALQRVARLLGPDWESVTPDATTLMVEDKTADKTTDEWSHPVVDKSAAAGPQAYWFKGAGGYVTFVWAAGRLNGEFQPPMGELAYTRPGQPTSAECVDLVTGVTRPLKLQKTADGVKAVGVPVGGMPIAVKWGAE